MPEGPAFFQVPRHVTTVRWSGTMQAMEPVWYSFMVLDVVGHWLDFQPLAEKVDHLLWPGGRNRREDFLDMVVYLRVSD
jgi:hypothetical protein